MNPLSVRIENLEARTTQQFAYVKSPVRVGRGELNDLRLDLPFVSTWHGVITFDGDAITFVDLGSTNGSVFDGKRLEPRAPVTVTPSSDLRIGPLRLHLMRQTVSQIAPVPVPARAQTQFAIRAAELASPHEAFGPTSMRPAATKAPAPAPVAPAVPPPPASGPDRAKEAVDAASWQLGVLFDSVKQAREFFDGAVTTAMLGLSDEEQRRARALIEQQFPSGAPAARAPTSEPQGGQGAATGLVSAFADSYIPGLSLDGHGAVQKFLDAIAEFLETSVKSFLELRRGYDEFGREMGIRVPRGDGAVARLKDAKALLKYLLEPTTTGEPRAHELGSAFAESDDPPGRPPQRRHRGGQGFARSALARGDQRAARARGWRRPLPRNLGAPRGRPVARVRRALRRAQRRGRRDQRGALRQGVRAGVLAVAGKRMSAGEEDARRDTPEPSGPRRP